MSSQHYLFLRIALAAYVPVVFWYLARKERRLLQSEHPPSSQSEFTAIDDGASRFRLRLSVILVLCCGMWFASGLIYLAHETPGKGGGGWGPPSPWTERLAVIVTFHFLTVIVLILWIRTLRLARRAGL